MGGKRGSVLLFSVLLLRFVPAAETAVSRSGPWRQFPLFQSENPGELLFHPRVLPAGGVGIADLHMLCMGMIPPQAPGGEYRMTLYEKAPGRAVHRIDRFPAAVRTGPAVYGVEAKDGVHFEPFVWRQSDNLVLTDRYLYYYRERTGTEDDLDYWKHWRYGLGSREAPERVGEAEFLAAGRSYNIEDFQHVSLSPDGRTVAFTDTYGIAIYRDPGSFQVLKRARSRAEAFSTTMRDFSTGSFFGEGEGTVLIGALSWSADGRRVYFDNSGVDYRCVWALDVEDRSVLKIVPEHDAIHPWAFTWNGVSCVAYAEGGAVRVAVEHPERIRP